MPRLVKVPLASTSKTSRWIWAVLVFAFLVRLGSLFLSQKSPFFAPVILDPEYYHRWALRIVGGDWIGDSVFYGLPLYPYFLAFCYKFFSSSIVAVKIIQALLGVASVYAIYLIGKKISGERVGILAGIFAAAYGPLFFHETLQIPEALAIPLYAFGFYNVLLFWDNPTRARAFFLGILLGLAALTKAGVMLFVLAFFFCVMMLTLLKKKKLALCGIIFIVAFFIPILPVTAHNWIYGKDFVPTTSHGGFNFYIGNNLDAEGVFLAPKGTGNNVETQIRDSRTVAEQDLGRSLKPSEVSSYWSGKAWNYILNNPEDFVRLWFHKLLLFFDAREISDVDDYEFAKKFNPLLRFPWLGFGIIGPLFLVGLAAHFSKLKYKALTLGWLASYILGVTLFFINARYRLPILSVILVVAAIGFFVLWDLVRERRWGSAFLYAAILALGVFVTQLKLVNTDWEKNYTNAGDVYLKAHNYEQAISFFRSALEIHPDSSKASEGLAVAMGATGHADESKEYLLKAIEANPTNAYAYNNLALWYDQTGDSEKAIELFEKAIELKPNLAEAHNNLAMVYGRLKENEKARQELEIALKLNPSSARAHTNLGIILYRLGESALAKKEWEAALLIDPGFEQAKKALSLSQE